MLTRDVRFEGWTTTDWSRFLELWRPRASPDVEPTRARGGLFAVHDTGHLRKLLHTKKGRIEAKPEWPVPLEELAKEHGASWVLSAHLGALDEVMERFGARVRREHDLTAQSLIIAGIVREMIAEGAIVTWPQRLRGIPAPTEAMVVRAVDALCADGRAICLGMFKDEELWTAFIARRRGACFDVIAGPDELRPAMGLLSGDWRRDYRHLARAVEERYAPLAFGCFAELGAFRARQTDARPGAWSRAVAVRDVVLSPIPVAVGLALGVDGARYALDGAKVVRDRIDPFGFLDPLLRSVRAKVGAAAGGKDLGSVLGFDPMAALRALLRRD
jgi:hypothetical protein